MSHFDSVTLAPADPILSLTEAFKADSNPDKINLSVGVFVDDTGVTPVLDTVREAEKRLLSASKTKSYLPITGSADYARITQSLCFGEALASRLEGRIVTAQTPGGTGGLRVAADFISANLSSKTVWVSSPTWANHNGIFNAAGLEVRNYAYFDAASLSLEYEAFIESIKKIPAGDIVVLHACCHNPTGADLTPSQWNEVVSIAQEKGWLPLLDFAYQGFGTDIDTDAAGVRAFADAGLQMFVSQSFSKNLGLYQDRVGAIHIVTESSEETANVASQVKICVRTSYSNPPAHGGAIVTTVLSDSELRSRWLEELGAMRDRINGVRQDFVGALSSIGVSRDFSFLMEQKGMFSFTGLGKADAEMLRSEYGIYIVNSGRINVAGITSANIDRVAQAIKAIVG